MILWIAGLGLLAVIWATKNKPEIIEDYSVKKILNFIREIIRDARIIEQERGIKPVVLLVQAAHESNFGLSQLSRVHKNLFGIKKSKAWTGGVANYPTKEVGKDGKLYTVNQYFKTYPSYLESMRDWADLLELGYPVAFAAAKSGNFPLFFEGLAKGSWGAYAGPTDGSFVRTTYAPEASRLISPIKTALEKLA